MKSDFGTINNLKATLYTLENKNIAFSVTNYGATLVSLVEKTTGRDVVLGLSSISDYQNQSYYLGATIGRVSNRIKDGKFSLNGEEYTLETNDRGNNLHGGIRGFDKRFFNVEEGEDEITFTYLSSDGEEGFPGTLLLEVTYKLLEDGISIITKADSNKDTLAAFTNHAYFNVNNKGEVLDNILTINASKYAPNDENSLALEYLDEVDNTVFDFRNGKRVGEDLNSLNEQLIKCGGYDHYFEVDGDGLRKMASVQGEDLTLDMYSDYPGLHFFVSNFKTPLILKDNKAVSGRAGLCLEAEYHPNAINYPTVLNKPILKADTTQVHEIQYRFTIQKVEEVKEDTDFPKELVDELSERVKSSKWRSHYHYEAPCGVIKGISRINYDDAYFVDYVWQPLLEEEYTYWQSLKSHNLTEFNMKDRTLKPDLLWDDDGALNGSSFIDGGEEYLIYVGKHIDFSDEAHNYVLIAKVEDGNIIKGRRPLLTLDEELSNPKIVKENNKYYLLLTKDDEEVVYRADSLIKGWEEIGNLKIKLNEQVFDNISDVSLKKLNDTWLLVYKSNNEYYYSLGNLNLLTLTFNTEEVNKLDLGFDLAKVAISKDKDILIGLLESDITLKDGYKGVFTLARELEVKDNKLIQKPILDKSKVIEDTIFLVEDERIKKDAMQGRVNNHSIIELENLKGESFEFDLFAIEKENGLQIKYEKYLKRLIIDRSDLVKEEGSDRIIEGLENGCDKLDVYIDGNVVEIYANDGEKVFSLLIYPEDERHLIRMNAKDVNLRVYSTKKLDK